MRRVEKFINRVKTVLGTLRVSVNTLYAAHNIMSKKQEIGGDLIIDVPGPLEIDDIEPLWQEFSWLMEIINAGSEFRLTGSLQFEPGESHFHIIFIDALSYSFHNSNEKACKSGRGPDFQGPLQFFPNALRS